MGDQQIRVLHVVNRLTDHGGAEVSLVQMLVALQRLGVENSVATVFAGPPTSAVATLQAAGVRVQLRRTHGAAKALIELARVAADVRPDVIHSSLWEADQAARAIAIALRVPHLSSLVNTQYGAEAVRAARSPWRLSVYRRAETALARASTHFHAISQAVVDHAVDRLHIPRERTTVIPRARDRDALGSSDDGRGDRVRASLGIPPGVPVLLNVGRREPQKGQRHLVEAFTVVAAAHPNAVLLLAGRAGSASAQLDAAISSSGLGARIRILGNREDVPDLLCAADVFVFSSLWEGLGGAVLEAMAMRRCIVAFDVPAVAEALGGTGLLAPVGDVSSLSRQVCRALQDHDLRLRLGSAAGDRFDSTFSMESVAPRMAALYSVLATGRGRRRHKSRRRADGRNDSGQPTAQPVVPLKVGHLITRADRRGAETFATALAGRLAKAGMPGEVRALLPGPTKDQLPVPVFEPRSRITLSLFRSVRSWARDYDVVVAHGSKTLPVSSLSLLGTRTRIVYVNIGDPAYWASSWHRRIRTAIFYRRIAAVAAISPRSAATLEATFRVPRGRIRVIPNARDEQQFGPVSKHQREAARRDVGVPADVRVVTYLGSLSSEKRVALLVEAVSLTDCWLVLAGSGPLQAELERQAGRSMPGRVVFLGQLADPRKALAIADVVALTSISEGLPGALIEASMSGLPVVATRVGMVDDVVAHGESGLLVDVDAPPETMARALVAAIANGAVLGAAGRARAVSMFGLDAVVDAWIDVLARVGTTSASQCTELDA